MPAIRPMLGSETPKGLSNHGTRKRKPKLLSECRGAGVKQVPLPASCTMKIIASSGPTWFAGLLRGEARFEASCKEAMPKNLHPPFPSFRNHHSIFDFLKKLHRRAKAYAVKDPPSGYQASPPQWTAIQSALPVIRSSDDSVLSDFHVRKTVQPSLATAWAKFKQDIDSLWVMANSLFSSSPQKNFPSSLKFIFQQAAKFNFNKYRKFKPNPDRPDIRFPYRFSPQLDLM